jgi:hypothetical protein
MDALKQNRIEIEDTYRAQMKKMKEEIEKTFRFYSDTFDEYKLERDQQIKTITELKEEINTARTSTQSPCTCGEQVSKNKNDIMIQKRRWKRLQLRIAMGRAPDHQLVETEYEEPQCSCNHYCVGCCCRELEKARREVHDRQKKTKKNRSPSPETSNKKEKTDPPKDERDKKKEKKAKKAKAPKTRPLVCIVGHSFAGHLASKVAGEAIDKNASWEKIMGVDNDNVDLRIYGNGGGATRFKFGEIANYITSHEADGAIIEMGTNDLCGEEDATYLANDLILNMSEAIEKKPQLQKCLLCLVIP